MLPCMNRTTCSISAIEPAIAAPASNGYMTRIADIKLGATTIA